jgi:hypothetical protein
MTPRRMRPNEKPEFLEAEPVKANIPTRISIAGQY